jgi:hypothetical protein
MLMTSTNYHSASNVFPLMTGDEFARLVDDIKKNGLQTPIVRYQGKILDGRNRDRACRRAKRRPKFVEYEGDDPIGFVDSVNFHRRHLTTAERRAHLAILLKRHPEKTTRQIAKIAKVSHVAVHKARRKAATDGRVNSLTRPAPEPEYRVDTIGRKQPTTRKRGNGVQAQPPPGYYAEPPANDVPLDTPENRRAAFYMRIDLVKTLAAMPFDGPIEEDMLVFVRAAIAAWEGVALILENRYEATARPTATKAHVPLQARRQ